MLHRDVQTYLDALQRLRAHGIQGSAGPPPSVPPCFAARPRGPCGRFPRSHGLHDRGCISGRIANGEA
jgi:hypothetical protein